MIRELFLPTSYGGYYLFSQRIIGFELGKHLLRATVIRASGRRRVVELCIEEVFDIDPALTYHDKASAAIKRTLEKVGHCDAVRTALPSSLAVFKELTLPFTQLSKIKMVLPFEIESLLPFSLSEAIVDCIITHVNTKEKKSNVLAAAVRRQHIEEHLALFVAAGVKVESISIDLFELFALFSRIDAYRMPEGVELFIDLSVTTTRIMLIANDALAMVRIIPKGVLSAVKAPQDSAQHTLEALISAGFGDETHEPHATADSYLEELQLAVQQMLYRASPNKNAQRIILTGTGADVPGVVHAFEKKFGITCDIFHAHKIIESGTITTKLTKSIPNALVASLAIALSSTMTEHVNLLDTFDQTDLNKVRAQQFVLAASLALFLLLSTGIYSFLSLRSQAHAVARMEQSSIDKLKQAFGSTKNFKAGSLSEAINSAKRMNASESSIWAPLSPEGRISFLWYLQELSRAVDAKTVTIKSFSMQPDASGGMMLNLVGSVDSDTARDSFEQALADSQLFEKPPRLEMHTFNLALKFRAPGAGS